MKTPTQQPTPPPNPKPSFAWVRMAGSGFLLGGGYFALFGGASYWNGAVPLRFLGYSLMTFGSACLVLPGSIG